MNNETAIALKYIQKSPQLHQQLLELAQTKKKFDDFVSCIDLFFDDLRGEESNYGPLISDLLSEAIAKVDMQYIAERYRLQIILT